jgi:hypothetical protein
MPQPTASSRLKLLFLGLSVVTLVLCALGATAHYLKWALGNPWQLVGWLLSMVFLLIALLPGPSKLGACKSVIKPKTAFFVFWIVFFIVAHLWHFRTAPWNGDGMFYDAAADILYLKTHVISRPFQAAWLYTYVGLHERETLFHYYLWPWLNLFGYNILSNEAALLALWCTTFLFTLLLTDLFFQSYVVTSVIALVFTFLPFAFIYSFVGYHYEMTAPLCVASLYFLHVGFKTDSSFCLSLGGIAAGLCLASSLLGQHYVLALLGFVVLYAVFDRKCLKRGFNWRRVLTVIYGFAAGAMPILAYIVFNRHDYAYHASSYLDSFWQAVRGHPSPNDITYYLTQLWRLFFSVPGPRLFVPDVLLIPLPYYFFLLPGVILALREKRYEIALLAAISVVGVFISSGGVLEHRLVLVIPFWIILMSFTFAGLLNLKMRSGLKVCVWGAAAVILMLGLVPSIQYIHATTNSHYLSMAHWKQGQVAVARFLRHVVAGQEHPDPPHLEHDEFNRVQGIPDPPYETLICAGEAGVILHMFLHDYDDEKILSFCAGEPMFVFTNEQDLWSQNKKILVGYVPHGKDLKIIWEKGARSERIIKMLKPARELGREESISFSFAGRTWNFYVLNISSENIPAFRERVQGLPDTLEP